MARAQLDGKAAEALAKLEEHEGDFLEYWESCKRCWDAYDGVIARRSRADGWNHKLSPPYIQHIVETMLASMLDEKLRFQVRPRPRLFEPGELDLVLKGAKAHKTLLDWQLDQDRFDEKQRSWVLQERVCGMSPAKVYWRTSTRKQLQLDQRMVGPFPHLVETETVETMYDGPCFDVIPVYDFVFDMSAPSVEQCDFFAHRIWLTTDQLKAFQKRGYYRNVDKLQELTNTNQDDDATRKFRDRVEVWEVWWRGPDGEVKVYSLGNRNTLLRETKNPFWHGEMPFVVFSAQSKPFRLIGKSQVQKLMALQEMIWTVSNQRLDNLELINNAIVLMRADADDPESFRFAPGAINLVDMPNETVLWSPDATAAQVSLPAEQMLKQDMQNLAGGQPFTSTGEARNIQANTATEASLVANIAQQNLVTAKTQLNYARRRVCQQMIELNKQFVRDETYVGIVDIDTDMEKQKVTPMLLKGNFYFDPAPMDESLMRNERRAEAQAMINTVLQGAPILMQIAAAGFMRPLDYERIVSDFFESHDKDAELYFKDAPPPAPAQGGMPGMPGQPGATGPGGVTNPMLAAGPTAPSNQNSNSGMAAMQQFMAAAQGGGRNA